MKLLTLLVFLPFLSFANVHVADTTCTTEKCGHTGIDDIVKKCEDPGHYNRQIPPKWVRVTCYAKYMEWVPGADAEFTKMKKCYGKVKVMTSKNDMAKKKWKMPDVPQSFSCYAIEEIMKKKNLEQMMSCEEFIAVADTIETWCMEQLEGVPSEVTPTGRTMSTCPNSAAGHTQY